MPRVDKIVLLSSRSSGCRKALVARDHTQFPSKSSSDPRSLAVLRFPIREMETQMLFGGGRISLASQLMLWSVRGAGGNM